MRLAATVPVLVALALALPARAAEVAGTKFADSITVEGKALVLNGAGVRTKWWVTVYAAGLWLEKKSTDAAAIVAADQVKRVQLVMKRDVSKDKLVSAIKEGFEKNSAAAMPKLKDRVEGLAALIPDTKTGDEIVLTYLPGKGVVVSGTGLTEKTFEGKDFADALFAVWLGAEPADAALKTALTAGN